MTPSKHPVAFPEPAAELRGTSAAFNLTITGVDADGKLFRERATVHSLRERACSYRSMRKLQGGTWVMVEITSSQKGAEIWKGEAEVKGVSLTSAGNGQVEIQMELERPHSGVVTPAEEATSTLQDSAAARTPEDEAPAANVVQMKDPKAAPAHHASTVTPVRQNPAEHLPFSAAAKPAAPVQAPAAAAPAAPAAATRTAPAANPAAANQTLHGTTAPVPPKTMHAPPPGTEEKVMASVRSFMSTEIHRQREEMKAQVTLEIHKSVQAELAKSMEGSVTAAVNTAMQTSMLPTVNAAVNASLGKEVDSAVRAAFKSALEPAVTAALNAQLSKAVNAAVAAELNVSLAKTVNEAVNVALDKSVALVVEPAVAKQIAKLPPPAVPEAQVKAEQIPDVANRVVKHLQLEKVQEQLVKEHREFCGRIAREAAVATSEQMKTQLAETKSEAGEAIENLMKKLDEIRSQAVSVLDSLQAAARQSGVAYKQANDATAKLTDATNAATSLMNQNMHSAAEAHAAEFTRKLERMENENLQKFTVELGRIASTEAENAHAAAAEKAQQLVKQIEEARVEQEERVQELIKITGTLVQREVKNALGKLAGDA